MKVIVDSCIWSLAFRRSSYDPDNQYVKELETLIKRGLVQLMGPIRQEILSGIPTKEQFKKLHTALDFFPDLELTTNDYVTAAAFFNQARKSGIQGSTVDFLIAATAVNNNMHIFSCDKDFQNFRQVLPIKLHLCN